MTGSITNSLSTAVAKTLGPREMRRKASEMPGSVCTGTPSRSNYAGVGIEVGVGVGRESDKGAG